MVNHDSKIFFVIVAAGSGSRFGSDIPKQFLPLAGRPVLLHAIETVEKVLPQAQIILVLSAQGKEYWSDIARRYSYPSPLIALGGDTRTESVRNALEVCRNLGCSDNDIIMVHDGARPLLSEDLLMRMLRAMNSSKAAIPVVPLTDSIIELDAADLARPADRNRFRAVQTPQAFNAALLIDAYAKAENDTRTFTDDASVVEAYTGQGITTVQGDTSNIKITNPNDIRIAELLIQSTDKNP